MSDLTSGDLVQVLHPGFSIPPLGLVLELNGGTNLFKVMMVGDENRGKIFRYSSSILRKVS